MSGPTGVSFAYPDVSVEERAKLALALRGLGDMYRGLVATGEQAFLLSTCLRVEVVTPGNHADLERLLEMIFAGLSLPAGVVTEGEHQIVHLFRVAAGVESPVMGEPEVLGQFRRALEAGRREGAIGGLFERLLGEAVSAGRSARKMMPGSPYGSLARVAARVAGAKPEVAVFGVGAMARSVVAALAELPVRVRVYARSAPAVGLPAAEVRPMDEIPLALASVPAAISATSAKRALLEPETLEAALRSRSDELTLVDMAMPPDFRPPPHAPHLRYIGLDDLADLAGWSHPSGEVDQFLGGAAAGLTVRLANHRRAGPVIEAILEQAGRSVEEEVRRLGTRLEEPDLRLAEQLAHRVVRRMLHRPISFLSTHDRGGEVADLLAEAFGVDHET